MIPSSAVGNMSFSTCEFEITSGLCSSAFVVEISNGLYTIYGDSFGPIKSRGILIFKLFKVIKTLFIIGHELLKRSKVVFVSWIYIFSHFSTGKYDMRGRSGPILECLTSVSQNSYST